MTKAWAAQHSFDFFSAMQPCQKLRDRISSEFQKRKVMLHPVERAVSVDLDNVAHQPKQEALSKDEVERNPSAPSIFFAYTPTRKRLIETPLITSLRCAFLCAPMHGWGPSRSKAQMASHWSSFPVRSV